MQSNSLFAFSPIHEKHQEIEVSLHFNRGVPAIGVLKGNDFIDGDEMFLSIMGKSSFPFSLKNVFLSGHAERLSQALLSSGGNTFYFMIKRGDKEYIVSSFLSKNESRKLFWLVSEKDKLQPGRPVVGFEQRYRRLFENIKDAVFASTVEGRFLDINPAGVEMLGYSSKEEVLNLNIFTDLYYYPEDRLKYQKIIAEKGYVNSYEVVFKKKDKTPLFVSMSNIAVYDEERKVLGYEGIFRDLTQQKQIREELQRKNAQLESYAYTVSHDLKSPIIAIQGYSRLIKKRYGDTLGKKGLKLLDRIMEVANRAERMIVDLLAYSRTEKDAAGDFEFIDTYKVSQSIIEELKLKWNDCPVQFVVSEDLPEILFHLNSFRQIMSNLIDNAIKYSQHVPSPVVTVDCRVEGEAVVFSVEDNGIGVDPALQKKIFDVFERGEATEEIEGTGIGLSIIKRIVETHHGEIWLDSMKGKGTTFYVRLPVRTLSRNLKTTKKGA